MNEIKRHSVHLKIDYLDGYRYLDRCGEYLYRANTEMGMIPDGNPNPQAGKLELPEKGLSVELNTALLRVSQSDPQDFLDLKTFSNFCGQLYDELFCPKIVDRIGVASISLIPFSTYDQACKASISWGPEAIFSELASKIGMPCVANSSEMFFKYGSLDLRVKISPGSFSSPQPNIKSIPPRATIGHKEQIERKNKHALSPKESTTANAIIIELDLTQDRPPPNQIDEMIQQLEALDSRIPNLLSFQ